MTIITIICIFAFALLVAPEVLFSELFAVFALPLLIGLLFVVSITVSKIVRYPIEHYYKFIEIGGIKYSMYDLMKKGYDCVSDSENWENRTRAKLIIKPYLPFAKNPMLVSKRINGGMFNHKTRILYVFRLKNGQYGLYKLFAEEPSYIYDENANVHKV